MDNQHQTASCPYREIPPGLRHTIWILAISLLGTLQGCINDKHADSATVEQPPNFLLIISDDQSWEHTSFAGYPLVSTPNFDTIAAEGLYFNNSYAAAPTCTASRSAILAGQPIWRLGSSALLWGYYSPQMISYQHILFEAGYAVGQSGKGWGPGKLRDNHGLPFRPAGPSYNMHKQDRGGELGPYDLAKNFEEFLDKNPEGKPFSFWAGSIEPHRPYAKSDNRFNSPGSLRFIPPFLPQTESVKQTLSQYLAEIEALDAEIGRLLHVLRDRQLLDNTVVIVTSDNGMPLSRAKAHNYMHGVRVPLAIRWGNIQSPGRVVDDFVNLADLAPTLLTLAGVTVPEAMTGQSLAYAFESGEQGSIDPGRDKTFTAFERHAGYVRGGADNLTYPRRAVHTRDFLYIRNYFPDRWPAGDPPKYNEAYQYMLRNPETLEPEEPYHALATAKRPAEELYDLRSDPGQLVNVADRAEYAAIRTELSNTLTEELLETGDPLQVTGADTFGQHEYLSGKARIPKPKE